MKRLMIVVPCYNEQEVFQSTLNELSNLLFELIKKGKIAKIALYALTKKPKHNHAFGFFCLIYCILF